MIILIIVCVITLFGMIIAFASRYASFANLFGILCGGVGGAILIIIAIVLAGMKITEPSDRAKLLSEREALVWQIERGNYDGSSNAVGEFNAKVNYYHGAKNNPWINIFIPPCYEGVDPIELP